MKRMTLGAALLAALAAGGAAFLWAEARGFDARAQKLALESPLEGVTFAYEEKARSLLSRDFALRAAVGDTAALSFTGKASFGFGTGIRLSIDPARDAGRWVPALGIRDFRDELTVRIGPTGSFSRADWAFEAFELPLDGSAIRVEPLRLSLYEKKGARILEGESGGLAASGMPLRIGRTAWTLESSGGSGEFRLEASGRGIETPGAAAGETRFSLSLEEEKPETSPDVPKDAGGVLDDASGERDVRYTERVALDIANPRWFGPGEAGARTELEAGDRFSSRIRLEHLTESMLERFAAVMLGFGLGVRGEAQAKNVLAVLQNALLVEGLAVCFEDVRYEKKGEAARFSGELARSGKGLGRDARLGRFELTIPVSFVPGDRAEHLAGTVGFVREGEALRAAVEIFPDRVTVNGRPLL